MPRDLPLPEPPGEDTPDLPESLGWFVAACTWVRDLVLAFGGALGRALWSNRACGARIAH